jgi:hypothetical protein
MSTSAPTPRPFTLHIVEDVLDDLRTRLTGNVLISKTCASG